MHPFEHFSDQAKRALTRAQAEAEAAGLSYIGTEQLLLGLIHEPDAIASRALTALGVEDAAAREAIASILGQTPTMGRQPGIIPTSRVKKVIELAFEEARRLHHSSVGTQHMLMALLIEGEGVAAQALSSLGVTLEAVRVEVQRLVDSGAEERATAGSTVRVSSSTTAAPELDALIAGAFARATARGSATAVLKDLLLSMTDAAATVTLHRLLDWHAAHTAKEEAIRAQDWDAAARHRTEEATADAALDRAVEEWRRELGQR